MKHTQGPWNIAPYRAKYQIVIDDLMRMKLSDEQIAEIDKPFEAISIGTSKGQTCIVPLDESNIHNAMRIVDCVNSMEGIDNPSGFMEWDIERIQDCVNACQGQNIEDVKLATAHRDACRVWERTMMDLVGEDGPGSVREAINKMKAELENERNLVRLLKIERERGYNSGWAEKTHANQTVNK